MILSCLKIFLNSARILSYLKIFIMEKLKNLLTSKKFWTLVAAIIAALTAFFTSSCTAQAHIQKHGVHCDTVKVDYQVRSRNLHTACIVPVQKSTMTPYIGRSTKLSETSTSFASIMPKLATMSYFNSIFRILPSYPKCSILSPTSESRSSIIAMATYSLPVPQSVLKSVSPTSGEGCSVLMMASVLFLPISRSKRGGRKGRPRPKIKTIPLGGSHL